jgi:hypothetical protein
MNTLNDITAAGFCLCRTGAHQNSILPKTIWAQFFQKNEIMQSMAEGLRTAVAVLSSLQVELCGLEFSRSHPAVSNVLETIQSAVRKYFLIKLS